jgi:hypothetical protein
MSDSQVSIAHGPLIDLDDEVSLQALMDGQKVWWGVFVDADPSGAKHVAPCDIEGIAMPGHTIRRTCLCGPYKVEDDNTWVHGVIQ